MQSCHHVKEHLQLNISIKLAVTGSSLSLSAMAAASGDMEQTVARLRKELEFVRQMMTTANTVEEFASVATAAAKVADLALQANGGPATKHDGAPYALTLSNLPVDNSWTWDKLKSYLNDELGVRAAHVEKDDLSSKACLRFYNSNSFEAAKKVLTGASLDGCVLEVKDGEDEELTAARAAKRGREGDSPARGRNKKMQRQVTIPGTIAEVVCPWWERPYSEQLGDKYSKVVAALTQVTQELWARTKRRGAPAWIASAAGVPPSPEAAENQTEGQAAEGDDARQPVGPARPAAPVLGIIRAPQIERYRNKNEFTCGLDVDGKPCCGFLLGNMSDGISAVAAPTNTRHTSRESLSYAAAMTDFLTTGTKLPVWDKSKVPSVGFWRLLLVREGHTPTFLPKANGGAAADATAPPLADLDPTQYLVTLQATLDQAEVDRIAPHLPVAPAGPVIELSEVVEAEPTATPSQEVLIMVQVNDKYSAVVENPALLTAELATFESHMRSHASRAGLSLTHVMVQYHAGVSNAAPLDAVVQEIKAGQVVGSASEGAGWQLGVIHDSLCDLRFRISPLAFFQVNSPATCVLYKLAGDWAAPDKDTVLFDVCCGTGTIGITLARQVHKVVGVDIVTSAIEDAKVNAQLNGITNVEYVAGKAEDVLPGLLKQHEASGKQLVAIVDPPRNGLHKSVVRALLACSSLKRLVYVSCNPASLTDNLIALCAPPDTGSNGHPKGSRGGVNKRPGTTPGTVPFVPIKAVAVDLFPHTMHVETVVLLERQ